MSCDINQPICQVRHKVGDAEEPYMLPDSVYQFTLDQNNTNILLAAIDIVRMFKADAAKLVRERVGEEEIFAQQAFENYCKLLDSLEQDLGKDLGSVGEKSGLFAGGTSNSIMAKNDRNTDNRRPTIRQCSSYATYGGDYD